MQFIPAMRNVLKLDHPTRFLAWEKNIYSSFIRILFVLNLMEDLKLILKEIQTEKI